MQLPYRVSIDGEIKSVTNNSNTKIWAFSLLGIGYIPRARLLSELATECHRHEVAGNQARGVQPACTMTTQNSKIKLISSIALKSRLISRQPEIEQFDWPIRTSHSTT